MIIRYLKKALYILFLSFLCITLWIILMIIFPKEHHVPTNEEIGNEIYIIYKNGIEKYNDEQFAEIITEEMYKDNVEPYLIHDWKRLGEKEKFLAYAFYYGPQCYYRNKYSPAIGDAALLELIKQMEVIEIDEEAISGVKDFWNWMRMVVKVEGQFVNIPGV